MSVYQSYSYSTHTLSFTQSNQSMASLPIKLESETAQAPKRGSDGAAGYDLYCDEESVTIEPGTRKMLSVGFSVAVPIGYYARIAPRSSLAWKHGIDVGAGVIDSDYRGLVRVILFNLGDAAFTVTRGDRIAQMILEKITTPEVCVVDDLSDTSRGSGGFGSTGLRDDKK